MAPRNAAIVLAGGRSARMGRAKASLDWHGATLLRRATAIVGRAMDGPVVVVRAPGQELAPLPGDVELTEDEREGRGPLQGIAAGLRAIGARADVAFVCAVDAPLLHPAFVRHVLGALGPGDDVALPRAHGFAHPLAAAYRIATVAPLLDAVLAGEDLGSAALFARCRVRELDAAELLADPAIAAADPELGSLANLNDPGEYERALALPAPAVTLHLPHRDDPLPVRAATLAAAARAAGISLADAVAVLNGEAEDAPDEPLVTGDTITFGA